MHQALPSRFLRLALVMALLGTVLFALPVSAVVITYYVGAAGDGAGTVTDCTTQSNTDCTLRDALAVATSGSDMVIFGTGFPSGAQTISIATNGTLTLSHSVTLTGPTNQTVAIDGGYNPTTHTGGVSIFNVTGNITFTISNLTIQHGNDSDSGGGIFLSGYSTLAVSHCVFTANAASLNGGAIYGASASFATGTGAIVNVADSMFTNNAIFAGLDVTNGGGAIAILNGLLTVTNSTFTGNTAPGDNNGNDPGGGAIFVEENNRTVSSPTIVIAGSRFTSNSAARGGAIWDDFGQLTVTNTTFTSNTASGDSSTSVHVPADGGGILQTGGTLTVTGGRFTNNIATPSRSGSGGGIALKQGFDCFCSVPAVGSVTGTTFTGNNAIQGGAMYLYGGGSLTVNQSAFMTNLSGAIRQERGTTTIVASIFTGNGGSAVFTSENLFSETSTATIINSTFSNNTGTGVLSDNATATTIINSTFYANAPIGIYQWSTCCSSSTTGTITLINTLVGSSAATGGDLYTTRATPSAVFLGHNNLIDDAASAGGFTNGTNGNKVGVAAGVGTLGNNGGPTQTIPLLAGSAAIGAASTSVCAAAMPNGAGGVDQRGSPRAATRCSIGAFEPPVTPNPAPNPRPGPPPAGGPPPPAPPARLGPPPSGGPPRAVPIPRR